MRRFSVFFLVFLSFFFFGFTSSAYEVLAPKGVRDNELTWYVHLPGQLNSGESFFNLFRHASQSWMDVADFLNLVSISEERPFCSDDPGTSFEELSSSNLVSTVSFRKFARCDVGWFDPLIAITLAISSSGQIKEADIAFNSNRNWESAGGLFLDAATHEVGHAIGLGHSSVPGAVMYEYSDGMTFDLTPDDLCGLMVINDRREECTIGLGQPVTTESDTSEAHFSGYASTDGGISRKHVFRPNEHVHIYATALRAPEHWTEAGSLHVVAQVGNAPIEESILFVLDENSEWVRIGEGSLPASARYEPWRDNCGLLLPDSPPCAPGTTIGDTSVESRDIAILGAGSSYPMVTGAMLGLEGQALAFWIAYTIDDDPELLVYGSEPIRVEWTLE